MGNKTLFSVLVLNILLGFIAAGSGPRTGCAIDLMNTFKLEGHATPRFNHTIGICGNVRDNCCTLYDQMKIVKLWKEYTRPVINHKVNQLVNLYGNIFSYHYYFAALPIESLPMYFTAERWVPYFRKVCEYSYANLKPERSFSFGDKPNKSVPKNYRKERHLSEVFASPALNSTDSDQKTASSLFGARIAQLPRVRALQRFERYLLDKRHGDQIQTLALSKTEVEGLRKIEFIQDKFHQAVHRSLAKVILSFTKRLNKLSQLKARLQRPLGLVSNELEMAAKDPTYLREVARRMASQQAQDDVFNVTLLGQVYINGEITDEQAKFKLNEKREALEKLIEEIDKQQGQLLAFQQAFLRKKMKINFDSKQMAFLIKRMSKSGLPHLPPAHKARMRLRGPQPPVQAVQLGKFTCRNTQRQFYRKFYIVNSKKFKYCDNVLWAIRKFDMQTFKIYLTNVRDTLQYMVSLRKSLYCALCDYNTQSYFDFKNQIVAFQQDFCWKYIGEFAEYFKWKDVLFVEYLNYIFQLIKCFDSPGGAIDFPFATMIDRYHKRTFFFKRCFDSMDSEWRFKYCHFICKEFRYDSITGFIEGDVKFLKDVLSAVFSFIRKQNVETSREILGRMKGIAGIEIPKFHPNQQVFNDIEDMIKKEEDETYLKSRSEPPLAPAAVPKRAKSPVKLKMTQRILEENLRVGINDVLTRNLGAQVDPVNQAAINDSELSQPEDRELSLQLKINSEKTKTQSEDQVVMQNAVRGIERRLTSDFLSKPIYSTRDKQPAMDNLRPFFLSGFEGLNPFVLESLTNFDFELQEYLEDYTKRLAKESITAQVMNTALQTFSLEKSFNEDINVELKDGEGHIVNSQSPAANPKAQQANNEALWARINAKPISKPPVAIIQGEYAKEGMPELEYIMN